MTKKNSTRRARSASAADTGNALAAGNPSGSGTPPSGGSTRRPRWLTVLLAVLAALALLAALAWQLWPRHATTAAPPLAAQHKGALHYVGSKACASCHADQAKDWRGSDHDLAMQPATAGTVLGDFKRARYSYAGGTTEFWAREGRYYVTTDGPDGKPGDFEIRYTFGVRPLQQYLIDLPGGKLQAFGIAWDTRPKADGGQRWFHLYPGQKLKAGDALHWTGINQNWNFMCAECHSTGVKKNYDSLAQTFNTTWSEMNVSCEACHGPGSAHQDWAKGSLAERATQPGRGLAAPLDERKGVHWTPSDGGIPPQRSLPPGGARELNACATCHARSTRLADGVHGAPLLDSHQPSLLTEGLYSSDGQQRDEVFTWASFAQSKMHAKGVTCMDCHTPHTAKLRAPGNTLCLQCHAAPKYNAPSHTLHKLGTTGASCIACHMPATTYMGVDPRHDHSLRVPRPDLSASMGLARFPNACNQCHADRSAGWAADALQRWNGHPPRGMQQFGQHFEAAQQGDPRALGELLILINDPGQPAIVRASAIERSRAVLSPLAIDTLVRSLGDGDALVRSAGVEALTALEPDQRGRHLARMLSDPSRAVRIGAARALLGPSERALPQAQRPAFELALGEYVASLDYNADRPEAQLALGGLNALRGRRDEAERHFRLAIKLDPGFAEASINLADLYRSQGSEGEKRAEDALRAALRGPADTVRQAALQHALGLALIRQKRSAEALRALAEAVRVDPGNARYAYVHAVATHDSGNAARAISILQAALAKRPYASDLLLALAQYQALAGRKDAALTYALRLQELQPGNPQYRQLATEIQSIR